MRVGCLTVAVCLATGTAGAQHAGVGIVRAVRTADPPLIDGRLLEEAWSAATPVDRFLQRDPNEGQPPSERTEIRVLYDGDALYFGIRLYDSLPAGISRRLTPRDEPPDADFITVYLDPRHDHRTGVAFTVTAAGVQRDLVISNDTFENVSWDAVWTSAVASDAEGWSIEMRLPFSQLRFNDGDAQTWGINIARHLRRANETAWLELVPKDENGVASRMAHLVGLAGVDARRQIELAPYTAFRQEFIEPDEPDNPLNDGARTFGSFGLDVKAPLRAGLTLDATFNPDFGQAEVDPAVINLSAFETFFDEKRRFFIEGAEIFKNFGAGGANSFFGFNTPHTSIFYSRRIGRAPQGSVEGDYTDMPPAATILGAAKVTGKTQGGWSIGLIEAVTGRERARVIAGAVRRRTPVEPLTNYFVGRLQRDFARGSAGVLTTAVTRKLDSEELRDLLPDRALVFGADGHLFFDDAHDWVITGNLSGSRITGTEAAIGKLQRAPQRYYQRPDAPQVLLDPERTSLAGYAGRVNLNRNSGVWRVNAALWGVSPGFDSNDAGFHSNSDRAGGHAVLLWNEQHPNRWSRSRQVWVARAWTWNFNREVLNDLWFGCGSAQFINYWQLNACLAHGYRALDDRLTRGGVLAVNPGGNGINAGFSTDGRKWLSLESYGGYDSDELGGWASNNGLTLTVKIVPSLTVSAGPQLHRSRNSAQYVDTVDDRPVFATIDQRQLSMTTRVSWTLNPRTSLQLFLQPLLATGGYGAYKELAAARTYEFRQFDPATPFTFDDPNFNLKSLKLNAVFRWEFRPGSTLYAVWTEQRKDESHPGDFRFRRDVGRLFDAPADDVLLLKMTYWLGR